MPAYRRYSEVSVEYGFEPIAGNAWKSTRHGVHFLYNHNQKKKVMLEQQLINAFMKLTARIGGGSLIRDMIHHVDENGNPKVWTAHEMENAIRFINLHIENFGKAEALGVIDTLMKKYEISQQDLHSETEPMPDTPGIQGLQ